MACFFLSAGDISKLLPSTELGKLLDKLAAPDILQQVLTYFMDIMIDPTKVIRSTLHMKNYNYRPTLWKIMENVHIFEPTTKVCSK